MRTKLPGTVCAKQIVSEFAWQPRTGHAVEARLPRTTYLHVPTLSPVLFPLHVRTVNFS